MKTQTKILTKGGRVIDPASGFDEIADVALADGAVLAIGKMAADFAPTQTIAATGCIVAPGLVDLAVRLREPGMSTSACSNPKWRPPWPVASPAWSAHPIPIRYSTSQGWWRCCATALKSCNRRVSTRWAH